MKIALRCLAVAILASAALHRAPPRYERVLVLALDGADRALIEKLAQEGSMPNFARLAAGAVSGNLVGAGSHDRHGFWRAVFSLDGPSGPRARLWAAAAARGVSSAVIGVPDAVGSDDELLAVLPGANESDDFIGGNVGRIANLQSLVQERCPWPYLVAKKKIADAVATLDPPAASDWISMTLSPPDGRDGMFRAYVLDADTVYLSPVYRGVRRAEAYVEGAGDAVYVPDDPAWTAGTSRLPDYYYAHVRDLSATRAEVAEHLLATRRRLVVYRETLLETVAHVYAPNPADGARGRVSAPSTTLVEAYRQVDRRLGEMLATAGAGTVVVVVARAPGEHVSGRAGRGGAGPAPAGFVVVGTMGASRRVEVPDPIDVARVAPTILYLLDIVSKTPVGAPPIGEVVSRYRRPRLEAVTLPPGEASTAQRPLTADSLRDLGLLSESAVVPARPGEDADALSSEPATLAR